MNLFTGLLYPSLQVGVGLSWTIDGQAKIEAPR